MNYVTKEGNATCYREREGEREREKERKRGAEEGKGRTTSGSEAKACCKR